MRDRVIAALLRVIAALLLAACTTRPDVTVQIEKGAVRVDPPELNIPVFLRIEQCDGGVREVLLTPGDGGK